jgi:adenosylmethionine---8-amino-7-oxononanoate aminotransferase
VTDAEARRARIAALDDACLWHPFTPMSVYRDEEPLLIERGEGHELIDVDGRRYFDGVSSIWCTSLGHGHPKILAAMHAQLDRLQHATLLGHANVPAVEFADRLQRRAPAHLERVFFSDNGSTAVEIALKMSFQYQRQCGKKGSADRRRFMRIAGSYHGDTLGAVGMGGISSIHAAFRELTFEAIEIPHPHAAARSVGASAEGWAEIATEEMRRAFERHGHELAAVVVEPGFQGAGGILVQPPGWLAELRQLAREAGALVIFDEVAVGMGRSGHMFACEREGLDPDFLCLAKAITAGYSPLAATITRQEIFEAFLGRPEEGRTFFHGHTFTGHPLGAAAGMATLDVFEEENVLENVSAIQPHLAARLQGLSEIPGVSAPRVYGLAAGIDLYRATDRGQQVAHDPAIRAGMQVCRHARAEGVFVRPLGDTIVFCPPLTSSREEIDRLVDAVEVGIRRFAESQS